MFSEPVRNLEGRGVTCQVRRPIATYGDQDTLSGHLSLEAHRYAARRVELRELAMLEDGGCKKIVKSSTKVGVRYMYCTLCYRSSALLKCRSVMSGGNPRSLLASRSALVDLALPISDMIVNDLAQ